MGPKKTALSWSMLYDEGASISFQQTHKTDYICCDWHVKGLQLLFSKVFI